MVDVKTQYFDVNKIFGHIKYFKVFMLIKYLKC